MNYSKALFAAHCHLGRSKKSIGRDVGISEKTVYGYFAKKSRVPIQRRASFDRVFGIAVDWAAYDLEFDGSPTTPPEPPEPPIIANRPLTTKKPQSPPQPEKIDATGGFWDNFFESTP